jgi:exonuclease III
VRGLRDRNKRTRLFNLFKNNMKGIIFLQEMHTVPGDLEIWQKEWGNNIFMSYGTSQSKGVAILIPNQLEYEVIHSDIDKNGRYIALEGTFNGHKLCLVNVYAPMADKVSEQNLFLDTIMPIIDNNAHQIILAGDLNCYLTKKDKYGEYNGASTYVTRMNTIIDQMNLLDIWRTLNQDSTRFTWRKNPVKGVQQSRLDYFIIANSLIYTVKDCSIHHAMYSDHNPVELTLRGTEENIKGRGFWKLNVSLLKDKEYLDKINVTLDEEIEKHKNMQNRSLAWDTIKMQVRSASISYSTYKAKKLREYEKQIKNELDVLEIKMSTSPDEDVKLQYYTNQKELEEINNQRARGSK